MKNKKYNELSVYCGWYACWWIPNWFKNIKVLFYALRRARQRARYGFCALDTLDYENWYVKLTIDSLTHFLKDDTYKAPGPRPDNQDEVIEEIIYKLKCYRTSNGSASADEYDEVSSEYHCHDFPRNGTKEDYHRIAAENEEVRKLGNAALKEAFELMGKHLPEFWD